MQTLALPDTSDLRTAGGLMLAAAVVLPAIPGHPGLACPLCGMTTSVEATLHGQVGRALAANPFGIVAVAVVVFLLVRRPATIRLSLPLVAAASALMWAFELHRFGFL